MKTRGWGAVALAYPAAALTGAIVVTIGFAAISTYATLANGMGWAEVQRGTWILPAAILYAFMAYLAGLVVIGTPAWWLLSRAGRKRRSDAVLAGAVLSSAAAMIFVLAAREPVTAWETWALTLSLAIPGAIAGWTLHRVAYGR